MELLNKIKSSLQIVSYAFWDECKTVFTDRGALLILLIAAMAYPLVYSIAYKNNVLRNIPIALVDHDQTPTSRQLVNYLKATPEMEFPKEYLDLNQAEAAYWNREVKGIIRIPQGFEKAILRGEQTTVSVYADASNFLFYKETVKSANFAIGYVSSGIQIKRLMAKGQRPEQALNQVFPFQTQVRNLYNPTGSYGSFVMPGIMLIIIQQTLLVGIGLVGGAGRERKRNQWVAPGISLKRGVFSTIFGKSMAYFTISIVNMVFSMIWIYHWFGFPDKGSLLTVLIISIPYILSIIFLGMALSLVFKHREHAIMFLVFLSPIILFVSGLSWPVSSMPPLLHKLFYVFPSTHMVPAFLRIHTMGVSLADVKPEFMFLTLQMVSYFFLACTGFWWTMKYKSEIKSK